jgi:hypothetical protein
MPSRYLTRTKLINKNKLYSNILFKKDINFIKHYNSPHFLYPNSRDLRKLNIITHIWRNVDSYYKLSFQHYGDTKLWWIIAWFNQKPTEAHVKIGDKIYIPLPLEIALMLFRKG